MSDWEVTLTGAEDVRLTLDQAFAAHHRLVYRYAFSLTRDCALAEDVAQEVFLRLHRHIDAAQQAGLLRAWLLRVAANVSRNLLRTRRRAAVRDEAFEYEMLNRRDDTAPDERLLRQSDILKAQAALAKLKEPFRSCLMLRHEGLSYREIASTLELKESNVGSLIARGRNEFMKLYERGGQKT
jgi:RNA polymerase sigma-70 factor (ECF subfamily)